MLLYYKAKKNIQSLCNGASMPTSPRKPSIRIVISQKVYTIVQNYYDYVIKKSITNSTKRFAKLRLVYVYIHGHNQTFFVYQ